MGTSGVDAGAVKAPSGLAQVQLSSICQHLGSCALWRGLSCATGWERASAGLSHALTPAALHNLWTSGTWL